MSQDNLKPQEVQMEEQKILENLQKDLQEHRQEKQAFYDAMTPDCKEADVTHFKGRQLYMLHRSSSKFSRSDKRKNGKAIHRADLVAEYNAKLKGGK